LGAASQAWREALFRFGHRPKEVVMHTQPAERTPTRATAAGKSSVSRTVTPVGRFLAELGGMCAVMCAGGGILSLLAFQIATWLGYPDLVQQSPYLSIVIITVGLSLPMAIYMAVRRHGRRHTVEMTSTTIGVGIAMVGLLWSGVISTSGLQTWRDVFGLVCGPACLLMIVQMLISFNMYSGRAQHSSATPQ
jgi:heme/copper-type cytochrome/quinol oxidase subunit 4